MVDLVTTANQDLQQAARFVAIVRSNVTVPFPAVIVCGQVQNACRLLLRERREEGRGVERGREGKMSYWSGLQSWRAW